MMALPRITVVFAILSAGYLVTATEFGAKVLEDTDSSSPQLSLEEINRIHRSDPILLPVGAVRRLANLSYQANSP